MFEVVGPITERLRRVLAKGDPAYQPPRNLHPAPARKRSTSEDSKPTGRKRRR